MNRPDIIVYEDGTCVEVRALLRYESNWKAYVYPEPTTHKRPHIHIECKDGTDCAIDLSGRVLTGSLKPKIRRKILYWLEKLQGRESAVQKWNELNPRLPC